MDCIADGVGIHIQHAHAATGVSTASEFIAAPHKHPKQDTQHPIAHPMAQRPNEWRIAADFRYAPDGRV
jgi:hypothetical protein